MNREIFPLFALTFLLSLPAAAGAQVFFEPVRYQYGQGPGFYYGGSDARVFAYAARSDTGDGIAGPVESRYFVGNTYRGPIGQPPRVFSDRLPYVDAALFGYTPADARNDANASVPTYYRMGDLLAAALPTGDGRTRFVPAQVSGPPAASIDVRPYRRPSAATRPATQPGEAPKPLLIIPKDLLRPPAAPATPAVVPTVAAAK